MPMIDPFLFISARQYGMADLKRSAKMKKEICWWLHGVLLGASVMLLVMQFCDADKSADRFARSQAVWAEQKELYGKQPIDHERLLHLSEKAFAIGKERELDPWIIRNLSRTGSILLILAVVAGWIGRRASKT